MSYDESWWAMTIYDQIWSAVVDNTAFIEINETKKLADMLEGVSKNKIYKDLSKMTNNSKNKKDNSKSTMELFGQSFSALSKELKNQHLMLDIKVKERTKLLEKQSKELKEVSKKTLESLLTKQQIETLDDHGLLW